MHSKKDARESESTPESANDPEIKPDPFGGVTPTDPTEILRTLWKEWPNVRQLIEGWKQGTPLEEWSEFDESVRLKTVWLSKVIECGIQGMNGGASTSSTTHENPKS